MLLDSHNSRERLDGLELAILLDVNDVSGVDLLVLADTLDGKTNRVSGQGTLEVLLVLLDREDLLVLEAGRNNSDNISGLKGSLLDSTADDLTNSCTMNDKREIVS